MLADTAVAERSIAPGLSPLVEVDDVSLVFTARRERTVALQDVSLRIGKGEFVSLIGPSGCGKTTLLRAIADLEQATSGSIRVGGLSAADARRARAYGYVFQAPALFPWRSVERNVRLPLEVMGFSRAEQIARARSCLELVGLAEFRHRFPWQLSGGMQQRVSIARALSFEPSLLLMDEPFGALDEISRDALNLHLHHLWRRTGMTVVFVTHSIQEAVFLSTRIVVMSPRPGRIVEAFGVDLPIERDVELRELAGFLRVAQRVRAALNAGHDPATSRGTDAGRVRPVDVLETAGPVGRRKPAISKEAPP